MQKMLSQLGHSFIVITLLAGAPALEAGTVPPKDEGFVETPDGLQLFYQEYGEGDRVVVAPGGMYLAGEPVSYTHLTLPTTPYV
jgi:hypothetical protein